MYPKKTMDHPFKNTALEIFQVLEEVDFVYYLIVSETGSIEYINKAFSNIIGFPEKELKGENLSRIIINGDQVLFHAISSNSNGFEATVKSANDVLFIAHIFLKVLDNHAAGLKNYVLFANFPDKPYSSEEFFNKDAANQDLAAKYKNQLIVAESELSEKTKLIENLQNHIIDNELRLRLSFNAVNDGIWDWNLEKDQLYFSDRFFTMLGYDAFEFPQAFESWISLIAPEEQQNIRILVLDLCKGIQSEFSFEYRMLKKDGSYGWVLSRGAVVEIDRNGKPTRLLGTHVDINPLKEIEISLKESEANLKKQNKDYAEMNERLSETNHKAVLLNRQLEDKQSYLNSILKTVPASITLISDQIILYANNYTSLMTGYEAEELLGHPISLLFDNPEELNRINSQLFTQNLQGVSKSITTSWRMKEGTHLDIYMTATHLDSDVASNAYTISAVDITAQRLYEEELINAKEHAERAERLKVVFLNNMSHELRTPMNGIIGFAEMLRETGSEHKKEEYLKVIINSSKQLLRIVTDIIDISKIESGETEVFFSTLNLPGLINELHENYKSMLIQRNKEQIHFNFHPPIQYVSKHIQTDDIKLRHILNCLLLNAVKYTESGSIDYGYDIRENFIEIFVKDTGIGIEASEKDLIFESFRQSDSQIRKKYGGNGLGLAIAKGFTQILGGKIWFESEVGAGSTFFVNLPYKPIIDDDNDTIMDTNIINWDKYHILIVEDDLTCLALIEELLEETHIKITHAATGLEAVKACRRDDSIHIVLMDMRLPEMDGYEATKRIKEFRPQLPIIAQTAHAFSEDRKKCLSAGCDDYITKPLEQERLFVLIEKYLNVLNKA